MHCFEYHMVSTLSKVYCSRLEAIFESNPCGISMKGKDELILL